MSRLYEKPLALVRPAYSEPVSNAGKEKSRTLKKIVCLSVVGVGSVGLLRENACGSTPPATLGPCRPNSVKVIGSKDKKIVLHKGCYALLFDL